MTHEEIFYRELGRVPELPRCVYANVQRKIHRPRVFLRAVLAAALFVIAAGTSWILFVGGKDRPVSPEAVAELQTAHNYLTGRDLDREYESFALYEEPSLE